MKYLIVVDMQKDFITGSLGSDLAVKIVPNVLEKIKNFAGKIVDLLAAKKLKAILQSKARHQLTTLLRVFRLLVVGAYYQTAQFRERSAGRIDGADEGLDILDRSEPHDGSDINHAVILLKGKTAEIFKSYAV